MKRYFKDEVEMVSRVYELRPSILYAMIMVESGGTATATRFEKDFFHNYIDGKYKEALGGYWPKSRSSDTERYFRAASWGPMQVMGQTARELGFAGEDFTELCDPLLGINFGGEYLRKMLDIFKEYEKAIGAYNGGPGSPNLRYSEKVLSLCSEED